MRDTFSSRCLKKGWHGPFPICWCLALIFCTPCKGQLKILITKFRSSYATNEKVLYEELKGSNELIDASKHILRFFNVTNGDYFTLECRQGCKSPRKIEFPNNSIIPKQNKDAFQTAYERDKAPLQMGFLILPQNKKDSTNCVAARDFEVLLKTTLYQKDTGLVLLECANNELLTDELALQNPDYNRPLLGKYTVIGEISLDREEAMSSNNPGAIKKMGYHLKLIDNATRKIIANWVMPNSDLSAYRDQSGYGYDEKDVRKNWEYVANNKIYGQLHMHEYSQSRIINSQAMAAATDLFAILKPLQRDTLTDIMIKWDPTLGSFHAFYLKIRDALPGIKLDSLSADSWRLTAACMSKCLAEMIRETDAGKNYNVDLGKNGVLVLSVKRNTK